MSDIRRNTKFTQPTLECKKFNGIYLRKRYDIKKRNKKVGE